MSLSACAPTPEHAAFGAYTAAASWPWLYMPTVLPVVYSCSRIELGVPATSLLMSEWFLSPKMTSPPSPYTIADLAGSPVMVKFSVSAQNEEKQYGVSLAAMLVPTNGCSAP